jgi:hypothetical protein
LSSLQHPSTLNELQRYRQVSSILRTTSRGRNKAWFQEALELEVQVHLRSDGVSIVSQFYNRRTNEWLEGPSVSSNVLTNPEAAANFADQLIQLAKQHRTNALGVILYIADEFAIAELKTEFDNPSLLPELRQRAETNPSEILEGASTFSDSQSFRILPYPAGGETIATAIALSRQDAAFLDTLRLAGEEHNFPIITHALSAPLIALMAVPSAAQPTVGKPFLTILYYSSFTVMGFFNERGDLRLLRTIQHRGQRKPLNLTGIATTTLAALELADPDILVLPLTRHADPTIIVELQSKFPKSRVDTVDWTQTPFNHPNIPAHCPELLIATKEADTSTTSFSHTFETFANEKWATQNFLPPVLEVAEIYPTRSEVKLLRITRLASAALVIIGLLALIWAVVDTWGKMRQPAWAFQPTQAANVQKRATTLASERLQIEHWDNLLEDRSKAWASMELLSRLIPENSGLLVKTFNQTTRPETAPGKSKASFIKEWRITGFAQEEARDKLNYISSREGINALFDEVARYTGNDAFRSDIGNRSILVTVRQQQNSAFKAENEAVSSDGNSYPLTFELQILQRFEANDPLAITTSKAP